MSDAVSDAFCTYFDHWYLSRGVSLARSLRRHRPGAQLWVLCLSDLCFEVLTRLALPGVRPLRLQDLEASDPEIAATRHNRTVTEYYFTCTPALPRYVLAREPDASSVTYLDADLFFFADPAPLFDELGDGSIAIIPHGFPPHLRELERHGVYNVGWVTFRRDAQGLACLRHWREQCIEWCYDRVEPGRFAEQKYLDDWPARFPGVVVLQHPGANLGPWNVPTRRITFDGGGVRVDGQPLIFYHAHGFRHGARDDWDPGFEPYGGTVSDVLRDHVFGPYLRSLDRERSEVDVVLDAARHGDAPFSPAAMTELAAHDRARPEREGARLARRATLEHLAAYERYIEELKSALSACEGDRAAGLQQIQELGAALAVSDADRKARLETIERIGRQLLESEADRDARLQAMERLNARLAEREAQLEAAEERRTWRFLTPLRALGAAVRRRK